MYYLSQRMNINLKVLMLLVIAGMFVTLYKNKGKGEDYHGSREEKNGKIRSREVTLF